MRTLSNRHTLPCDVDTFWRLFRDPELNKELYLRTLGFQKFEVLKSDDDGWRIAATPKVNMPKAIAALFGDGFSYEEEARFDADRKAWRFKIVTRALGQKFRNEGVVRAEPAGEGKCTRLDELTLEAKVFGVGGMIEGTAEKEARDGWVKTNALFERWIAEKLRAPG